MLKVSKESWVRAGQNLLAKKGEEALTIDHLSHVLRVSKGSFYHHFSNIDHYIAELLELWSIENTAEIIRLAKAQTSFDEKIEVLNRLVFSKDVTLEVRIRAWGMREPSIGVIVSEIDYMRTAFLAKLYRQRKVSKVKAMTIAQIEYAAFTGALLTLSHLPAKEFRRIGNTFQKIIKNHIQ
jgi:AcrR family transcriptional regulator